MSGFIRIQDGLEAELKTLKRRISTLERARRLPHSSNDASVLRVSDLGEIRSANYKPGVSGWRISAAGDAEFDDITFRGQVVQIGPGEVGETELADGAVTTPKVADGAVDAVKLADSAVNAQHLVADAVGTAALAAQAVTSDILADAAVDSTKLANLAVTAGKLADGSVDGSKLEADSVDSVHIVNAAVGSAAIANLAVGTGHIQDLAVVTGKIADLAVGTGKIAEAAITSAKIGAAQVDNAAIAVAAVQAANIGDLQVTNAKIADVSVEKLTAGILQVGTHIRSTDYTTDPEGNVTGFTIEGDGHAQFSTVVVGNTEWQIDEFGGASFRHVSTDSLNLDGRDMINGHLWERPKGVVAWGERHDEQQMAPSVGAYLEISFTAEEGRMYRIQTSDIRFNCVGPGYPSLTNPAQVEMQLRADYEWNAIDKNSPLVGVSGATMAGYSSGNNERDDVSMTQLITCDSSTTDVRSGGYAWNVHPGVVRLLLCHDVLRWGSATPDSLYITTPGRNAVVLVVEDIGPYPPDLGVDHYYAASTGDGGSETGGDTLQQYVKTYDTTWTTHFKGDNTVFQQDNDMGQGYYSSINGNRVSWIGFNDAQIRSDLAGAEILKCELYLYFEHWYYSGGGTAVIGTHHQSGRPSHRNTSVENRDRRRDSWNRNEGKWLDVGKHVGEEFRDNVSQGWMIGPGPSTNREYYGRARGHGQSYAPKMRITYKK